MASSNKLVLTCETAAGDKNFSYNYVNPEAPSNMVKAVGTALVTNNSIFQYPPLSLKAAKIVKTTEIDYDLS